ncbi:MAG: sigma 54-interacting transcriptional regulator [Kofleriaceae bacterium]|nr:sigma 54-interacting transcriptional regulator [Kofleriaceae bacterium]
MPADQTRTLGSTLGGGDDSPPDGPIPGAVLVFSEGHAVCGGLPLADDRLEVGRGTIGDVVIADGHMSRRHVEISRDANELLIRDLGSRNGFVLDGVRVPSNGEARVRTEAVLRLGNSIFLVTHDVRLFREHGLRTTGGAVIGPRLAAAYKQIAVASTAGDTVHITGESGAGKELAAREFHRAGPTPSGSFVAVNSASIPEGVAERLLFGARKGAFSGAHADAEGYVQAADGGTLFLDEIGELDTSVQAKLLRVLESREVLPVGASRPVRVMLRIVSATNRDLRAMVGAKTFREDLFYRLGRPQVSLPSLRERREEIPALARIAADRVQPGIALATSLVEACMLRRWPGNVRELLRELQDAASRALAENARTIEERHLDATAGTAFTAPDEAGDDHPATSSERPAAMPPRELVEQALRDANGAVVPAARALGVHRNQLRRWLARHQLDPKSYALSDTAPPEE